jgi:hypothetical protein
MKPVDVLIHFRQHLDAGSKHVIETTLRSLPGVVAPWFAPQKEFLVVVYYNPSRISSIVVLNSVRRLGFKASLVAI